MNLHSRKARVPIAALGVTALCTAGLGVAAGSAFAAGTVLGFGPTNTSATITDISPNLSPTLAYGLKVTPTTNSDTLVLNPSADNPGPLYIRRRAANAVPAAVATTTITGSTTAGAATSIVVGSSASFSVNDWVTIGGASPETVQITAVADGTHLSFARTVAHAAGVTITTAGFTPVAAGTPTAVPSYAVGDNIFFGALVPGDYSFSLFKDNNGNTLYDSAQDEQTPTFTLHVKDVTTATASTSDDLNFGLSVPSTSAVGQTVAATATLGGLSSVDTRGGTVLGDAIALATTYTFVNSNSATFVGAADNSGAPSFSSTTGKFSRASGVVNHAGTVTTTATLGSTGSASGTTLFDTNGVTATGDPAVTAVTGSVKAGTNTATIKPGTAVATYSATVTDAGTKTDDLVYFTLTPGTHVPALTADGTLVSNTSGTKVYSVLADSSGVASISVTSSDTTTATTYTVAATSNAHDATNPLVATYATPAAASGSFQLTNTASELTPTVPTSGTGGLTFQGKLLDQFGGAFQPSSPASNPAKVEVDESSSTFAAITGSPIYATIASDGTFSAPWTRSTAASAGDVDSVQITLNGSAPTKLVEPAVTWASATAPGAITLSTPTNLATGVNLSDSATLAPGQNAGTFGSATGQVTGVVKDSGGTALAYKTVTVTGSAGVYFSTSTTGSDLTTSAQAVSNGSGSFSGIYAFFTKSGSATVTATSGTATQSATLTTDVSADPYTITVNDVSGKPGATLIVTGTIKDAFGNVVPGEDADLSIGTSTLGAFGDSTPTTNSLGVFSTTFTTGSNSAGTATITATLYGQSVNPTPAAGWLTTAKITVPVGKYQDTGSLTVADTLTTITATDTLSGGGAAEISGTAESGASVEVWARASGESAYALVGNVMADSNGVWTDTERLVKTTSFFAKSNGKLSSTVATVVYSTQTVTAKALGKGKVQFKVYGTPNVKGTVNIYEGTVRIGHVATNSVGDVTTTVQSKAGRRTFRIYFVAPGTTLKGRSLTGTVK